MSVHTKVFWNTFFSSEDVLVFVPHNERAYGPQQKKGNRQSKITWESKWSSPTSEEDSWGLIIQQYYSVWLYNILQEMMHF